MKPVYKSVKVWTAVLALVGAIAAHYTGSLVIAAAIVALGSALLVAIGLSDFGKEGRAIEAASWEPLLPPSPSATRNKIEFVVDVDTSQAEAAIKKALDAADAVETPEDE